MTGQVKFSSPYSEGIQLDFYQVIVKDITNQTVINNITTGTNISVGELFLQQTCSPYLLTVQAHNKHGFTDNNVTIISKNDTRGGRFKIIILYRIITSQFLYVFFR